MPTYRYKCPACGHGFEKFHKMTDPCCPPCPECGVVTEQVITGGAGLLFKGSGFYETDYKRSPAADKSGEADAPAPKAKPDPKPGGSDSSSKRPSTGD